MQRYCQKNSRDGEEQQAEMSFILWTGSLNIWHHCMRLKGHCVALLSGASLGLNNRTVACWLGCQQSCLRWDVPCLSWSGVPPEMLCLRLKPGKEGALRRCNVCIVGRFWLQSCTATLCSNAARWNRQIAKVPSRARLKHWNSYHNVGIILDFWLKVERGCLLENWHGSLKQTFWEIILQFTYVCFEIRYTSIDPDFNACWVSWCCHNLRPEQQTWWEWCSNTAKDDQHYIKIRAVVNRDYHLSKGGL